MKRPIGLDSPMDQLQAASSAPEVDFSKNTLLEQIPEAKTVGGEEVKAPGAEFDAKAEASVVKDEIKVIRTLDMEHLNKRFDKLEELIKEEK